MSFDYPEDGEFVVARELLNQKDQLQLRILEELMGERKRYSQLKHLLAGKGDNVLTKALQKLQDHGAIQPGISSDLKQKTYALTPIGKNIIFRAHEMGPHYASILAYERGRGA